MTLPTATNLSASDVYRSTASNLTDIVLSPTTTLAGLVVKFTIPDQAGSLTATSFGGASLVDLGDGEFAISGGTLANINSVLASLSFVADSNYKDTFNMNVEVTNSSGSIFGTKQISWNLQANDVLSLGDQANSFLFKALANAASTATTGIASVDAGDGIDTLIVNGATATTVDLSSQTLGSGYQVKQGTTTYRYTNFEHLDASKVTAAMTVIASADGSEIKTGSAADKITLGAGADTVEAGLGNDSVQGASLTVGALSAGDGIDLGGGNDQIVIDGNDVAATADGGAGIDTLLYVGAGNGVFTFEAGVNDNTLDSVDLITTNFENLNAASATGDLTVTLGANTTAVITGSGDDTITYRDGLATTAVVNAGTGTQDTLILDPSAVSTTAALNINLAAASGVKQVTNATATYLGFENLSAADWGANLTVTASTTGSVITTGYGADTVTLGVGVDTVVTGEGNDRVIVGLATTLGAADQIELGAGNDSGNYVAGVLGTIDAGDGVDTLTYAGTTAQTINFNSLDHIAGSHYKNFENLSAATATGALNVTATAATNSIVTGAGADTINAALAEQGVTINAGAGVNNVTGSAFGDLIVLGAGADLVNSGDGADTVSGALTLGDNINLGDGSDTYSYQSVASTTVDGGAGIDTLKVAVAAATAINLSTTDQAGAGVIKGFENVDGAASSAALTVTASTATTSIATGGGNDVVNASAALQGVTINAGGTTNSTAADGSLIIGFNTVTGSNYGDTITLGTGKDIVNAGDGADSVIGTLTAGDQVNLGAGDDVFAYQGLGLAGTVVDGGTGTDSLTYGGSIARTVNFLTTTDNLAAENGIYRNFENLAASGATGALTVTAGTGTTSVSTGSAADRVTVGSTATQAMTIATGLGNDTIAAATATVNLTVDAGAGTNSVTTGSGADSVTLGTGADTVNTGAGNDTLLGAASVGDSINLGTGNDTATYSVAGSVNAGDDNDTLSHSGAGNLTIALGSVTNVGGFSNFE
ncbi:MULTISPECIES: beta strand repeat-containing protein, partial [Deefgea]